MFIHSVYFWLREDLSPDELKRFVDGVHALTEIGVVKQGYVGIPAATNRPIIDRSYSYALILVFEDEAGHDAYQSDPVHGAFRDDCGTFWREIKIYDFVS